MLNKRLAIYKVRQMLIDDLEHVLNIQTICHLGEWGKTDFEKELSNPTAMLYVAAHAREIAGFVDARLITKVVEILSIGVLPKMRKQGIGKILLQKIFELSCQKNVSESWLEVRESNLTAQSFYCSQGYKIVGRRRNYYSNPDEDAILMTFIFSDKNPKK